MSDEIDKATKNISAEIENIKTEVENTATSAANKIADTAAEAAAAMAAAAAAVAAAAVPATKNVDEIHVNKEITITTPTSIDSTDNGKAITATTSTTTEPSVTVTATGPTAVNGDKNLTVAAKMMNAAQLVAPKQQQESTTVALSMTGEENNEQANATNKAIMDTSDSALFNFKVLYVVAELCGLTVIVLMGSWVGIHLGGLSGQSNPATEFNWHPLLMTIGLIFLYGNSILVYRGFRSTRKKTLKLTHASIHMGAFILTVIALKAAFDSHNLRNPPIPNMYSLHSWLGLSAVLIFSMQYVAGFAAFLVPGLKDQYKIALMPMHIYFGIFGFVLAISSALTGIVEKAFFSVTNYSSLPSSGVMANVCGVLFVVFGGLVVYLVTEPSYKRKPIPEDAVLLTGVNG